MRKSMICKYVYDISVVSPEYMMKEMCAEYYMNIYMLRFNNYRQELWSKL